MYTALFNICNIAAGVTILVYYFTHFKDANQYFSYGFFVASVFTFFQFLSLIFGGVHGLFYLLVAIFGLIISFFKVYIYVCTGMYLCSLIGYKDIPIVRKILKSFSDEEIKIKEYIINVALVAIGFIIFSVILFKLTSPQVSAELKSVIENKTFWSCSIMEKINMILSMFSIVISEELIFRFVMPNLIAKFFDLKDKKYWIAIIITSIFWAFGHLNALDPAWVKFVQVFPGGIALGWLYKKHGLESSMIAHLMFNIALIFLSDSLILM